MVTDIDQVPNRLGAAGIKERNRLVDGLCIGIEDRDLAPFGADAQADLAAETAGPAGHDGDLVGEPCGYLAGRGISCHGHIFLQVV